MIWMMIESPGLAFKKIIIAEHKNFVLLISLFFGISSVFTLMWARNSGNLFDNLFPLLLLGIVIGLGTGVPLFYLFSGLLHGAAKMFKGSAAFKETYAIAGWSLVPVMLSAVFVLPLELGTLGLQLFSSNPSALEVKPVVTMVLLGLDGACLIWSVILSAIGLSMAHRFRFITGLIVTIAAGTAVSFISLFIYSSFTI